VLIAAGFARYGMRVPLKVAEASVDLAFGRHVDDVGVNVLRRVGNCTVAVHR
jgi:hypothetical protein